MDWINSLLDSPLGKGALLPALVGIGGLLGYLIRRRLEGAPEARDIDALHRAADLREKLRAQNVTLDDLKAFRQQALGNTAQVAVETAQQYVSRAQYLVELPATQARRDWPEATTQAEMNAQAAAQFGEVDDELTALLVARLATADPNEAVALQRAQDAWRTWRDEEAIWDARTWEGGTIRSLLMCTKLEQLTRERIAALRADGSFETNPKNVVIPYRNTPRNLCDHIEPGTTESRVREILGPPHFIAGSYWHYRFIETRLEIVLEGEVVRDITFALIDGHTYTTTIGGFEEMRFGVLTFEDLQQLYSDLEIQFNSTMRTNEIYTRIPLGVPGAWSYYYFGAVVPYHGGTQLLNTNFEWDHDANRLVTPLGTTVVNWFGQTSSIDDRPGASWFIR